MECFESYNLQMSEDCKQSTKMHEESISSGVIERDKNASDATFKNKYFPAGRETAF